MRPRGTALSTGGECSVHHLCRIIPSVRRILDLLHSLSGQVWLALVQFFLLITTTLFCHSSGCDVLLFHIRPWQRLWHK